MDNYKIGKLISKLRKEKGLTQQQLGELVGVGDRAVSKWERGISVPDIAIINNLSQILGISSDELLSGEIKERPIEPPIKETIDEEIKDNNKKSFTVYIKFIIIPVIIIIAIISIILINNNKTYVYDMLSEDPSYTVDGKVILKNNKISIAVNNIKFEDKEFLSTVIKNYEYDIKINDIFIFKFGYIDSGIVMDKTKTIDEFTKELNINYKDQTKFKKKDYLNKNIIITFRFLNENEEEIIKVIKTSLVTPNE